MTSPPRAPPSSTTEEDVDGDDVECFEQEQEEGHGVKREHAEEEGEGEEEEVAAVSFHVQEEGGSPRPHKSRREAYTSSPQYARAVGDEERAQQQEEGEDAGEWMEEDNNGTAAEGQ